MNLGFSPSPFPMEQINDDKEHDQQHNFGVNHQIVSSSSSSSASCHIFFNSTQDHAVFYHPQLMYHRKTLQEDYYSYDGGSSYKVENIDEDGATAANIEVKKVKKVKVKASSSLETDVSSNTSSFNCNTPIRVCSDCHTTKTPLWRSGPKGPKSLCNACGIRQRKARRAMAAAAAGGGGGGTKAAKEKIGKSGQLKKRCSKLAAGGGKKMGLEDLLRNLSNKLAFHGVFPQDEKEAAILLMALSSGLVHG